MGFSIRADWAKDMDGMTLLHRFRFHLGRGFVSPGDTVLDLGCGTGYGSQILSKVASQVTAIDIDEPQIKWNTDHYEEDNILFIQGNLEEMDLPFADVACSFEVVEHLYKPAEFITKLKQRIKKWIIVSVPIGETLIDVNGDPQASGDSTHHSVFLNPYHLDYLFVDDQWQRFYGIQTGVTYIAVYYKYEQE